MTDTVQRTDLKRYVPYVMVATTALFLAPMVAAYRLTEAPFEVGLIPAAVMATLTSLGLARLGAALWLRHPGSRDVVFEDLLLWGFCLRLLNQRRVIKNAKALARGLSQRDELNALQKLAKALESGDPYTHGHSDRVARHAYMTARAMKLPRRTREKVRLAGALHDVGKLRTPRAVLTKPGRLTTEEYEIIKQHPSDGADMVAALRDDELTVMVRHHHERMDGTGYPDRLHGDSIPIGARIIAVVDTFDAITSRRPYRAARKHKDAIDILVKESATHLDEAAVKAFITYYTGRRGIRLWLSLSTSLPRVVEALAATARRVATNAAVVGGTTAAVMGGVVVVADAPTTSRPVEKETVVVNEAEAVTNDEGADVAPVGSGVERSRATDPSRRTDRESADGATEAADPASDAVDAPAVDEQSSTGSVSGGSSGDGVGSSTDNSTSSDSTDPTTTTTDEGASTEPVAGATSGSGGSTSTPSGDSGSGGSGSESPPTETISVTTPTPPVGTEDPVNDVVDSVGGLL